MTDREYRLICERFADESDREAAVKRLNDREPLAYILGEWYFYRQTYKITPDCLIPRPDTEHLVEQLCKELPRNGRFADLCTGSGCIAISTLCERTDCSALAVDISKGAVCIANENAKTNGVSDRIEIVEKDILCGDCLEDRQFDIIVSNPPYIRSDVIDTLEYEVLQEPRAALDGGDDGLLFYRAIIKNYTKNLKDVGAFIFEIGYDQASDLEELCKKDGFYGFSVLKDYSGNDRVVTVRVSKQTQ